MEAQCSRDTSSSHTKQPSVREEHVARCSGKQIEQEEPSLQIGN